MLVQEARRTGPGTDSATTRAQEPAVIEPSGQNEFFASRHIGPSATQTQEMLRTLGYASVDGLIDDVVPPRIRLRRALKLPPPQTEHGALATLKRIAAQNKVFKSFIGMGYYDSYTPAVIQRNVLENPGWYTQYTPYQAEISQGRLEALLTFQTMVMDLTAMEVANASLLDEATAAAEAMAMCHGNKPDRTHFLVSSGCHPQTIEVVRTRAEALGLTVVVAPDEKFEFTPECFGALVQYPSTNGTLRDLTPLTQRAHAAGALVAVATDLLCLCLFRPPGEMGADVVLGSAQRFGVPLGYGGPHAAFFATRDAFKRQMPGRIVGVSKDSAGRPAYRLSLQTREQHIRREKATSNICTAQALLANMAALYACYHGPEGLRQIARRVHSLTQLLAEGCRRIGLKIAPAQFFDTVQIPIGEGLVQAVLAEAHKSQMNFRKLDEGTIGVSLDETTTIEDVEVILEVLNGGGSREWKTSDLPPASTTDSVLHRTSRFLSHPVFNRYHSETEMLRYLKRLESRDLSLTASMIPLGSCTMKLNATSQMLPVTWPEFGRLHPFAPVEQARGYAELFRQLETWLSEITGFGAVSLQPNAGSQGEYAGLLAIRLYHLARGDAQRNICLIPTSAHGTNPASAVMAGFKVVAVACDRDGNVDLSDLRAKVDANKANLAALMVTYPSTHGVFEESITEICSIVHAGGGQVYMDGANMNAQVGLCRPADIGADVCHLNLHKTFAIPHGGGGPGMGPIGVAQHLAPFLPGHSVVQPNPAHRGGAVSAAPWGSASILPVSWMYIMALGPEGVTRASQFAILNANYIAKRLRNHYQILYQGRNGLVAHECILDLRQFKTVSVEDVAKRLMDYGFHAPTISWPVAGTIMVEPTESESKEELDRFCDAMITIHAEISEIETGEADKQNNLLKNAPHTAEMLVADNWNRPYSRERACYPVKGLREFKFWPAVGRIDNVYGDRNLVCSCAGMEAYAESQPK